MSHPNAAVCDLIRPSRYETVVNAAAVSWTIRVLVISAALVLGFGVGWSSGFAFDRLSGFGIHASNREPDLQAIVTRIIAVESDGDRTAKSRRSSALGLGQFLDQTWLDLIRAHRSDLAKGRSEEAILALRVDETIAREITALFAERNAAVLRKRGLPVTPAILYLAHFAGVGGAIAVLSAVDNADAASIMAGADGTGRTTREAIIKANPFIRNFTVADLKNWADRKMKVPGSAQDRKFDCWEAVLFGVSGKRDCLVHAS
jgi:hypothetical protein